MAKNGKKGIIRKSAKSLVNVPRWMGLRDIASGGKIISTTFKSLFSRNKTARKETFEEAAKRLNLSEEDLKNRKTTFLRRGQVFFCIGLALLCYTVTVFITTHFLAGLLSFALSGLTLSLALKDHFWYTQMKHRRLGLTLKDWANLTFRLKKQDKKREQL